MAGVEVWFDQSELRGGDAWDQKIRDQIQTCALFVPVISENTQSRPEGYFRLEWKLAVDRSHLMSDDHPFLVPVVIDETTDAAARACLRDSASGSGHVCPRARSLRHLWSESKDCFEATRQRRPIEHRFARKLHAHVRDGCGLCSRVESSSSR